MTGFWNHVFFHGGFRQAIRGFALPLFGILGAVCLIVGLEISAFSHTLGAREFLAFLRPLSLMLAGVCWAGVVVFGLWAMQLSLSRRPVPAEKLLRFIYAYLAAAFFPLALLASYIAAVPTPGHGTTFFQVGGTIWLIYFAVGVGFAAINGVWNLRWMWTVKR